MQQTATNDIKNLLINHYDGIYDKSFRGTTDMLRAGTIKPYEVAFTIDMKDDFFIHAVLLKATYFYPYDIYIGSDPDWSKNQKFTGFGNCANSLNYDCTEA